MINILYVSPEINNFIFILNFFIRLNYLSIKIYDGKFYLSADVRQYSFLHRKLFSLLKLFSLRNLFRLIINMPFVLLTVTTKHRWGSNILSYNLRTEYGKLHLIIVETISAGLVIDSLKSVRWFSILKTLEYDDCVLQSRIVYKILTVHLNSSSMTGYW